VRIAVTGREGQVVQSLIERSARDGSNHIVIPLGRPELDLADVSSVRSALAAARPDAIVSAAAYTAVDKAESDPDMAFAVNAIGAGAVAEAAAALGVPLVHLSTDFVFDGSKPGLYVETDPTAPLGVYGASKLAGEQAVLAAHDDSAILRTAWIYSPFGANFLKTMLRLAADRDELGVVADQMGNPTSALDIADTVLRVVERLKDDRASDLRGVFHMTSNGGTSWAGFAEAIFAASVAIGGPAAKVRHIPSTDYPTPARRPANSRLDCTKLAGNYGVDLGHWTQAVDPIVTRYLS
jgi:dTDP-4-dehydrorhamnose reductase